MASKKWALIPIGCAGVLALGAVAVLVTLFLVKVLWAWTVPDLFPRAVEEGYVAATISWMTAFKVALFVGFLAALSGARRGGSD